MCDDGMRVIVRREDSHYGLYSEAFVAELYGCHADNTLAVLLRSGPRATADDAVQGLRDAARRVGSDLDGVPVCE